MRSEEYQELFGKADHTAIKLGVLLQDITMSPNFRGDPRIPAPIHLTAAVAFQEKPELRKRLLEIVAEWGVKEEGPTELTPLEKSVLDVIVGKSTNIHPGIYDLSGCMEGLLGKGYLELDPGHGLGFKLSEKTRNLYGLEEDEPLPLTSVEIMVLSLVEEGTDCLNLLFFPKHILDKGITLLSRRGYIVAVDTGQWSITEAGKKALEAL